MKTIMVTGAAGMIGKAVVEMLLQKGFDVIGTDNAPAPSDSEKLTYIECDITDKEQITGIFRDHRIDALIHLACTADNDFGAVFSPAEEKKSSSVDKFLYKAAESAKVKDILLMSTYQIYAPQKTREPIRETMDDKPVSIYAKLKYDSEHALANAVKKSSSSKGVIMRICPVYTKEFVDNLKSKVYDEKDGCGYVYGYGDYGYTFTCLYNIVDFVYGILTCDEGINYSGIYNVCDTKPIAAKDIVEFLRAEHKIGAVLSRDYGSAAIKGTVVFGSKAQKTEYRYNDVSTACSNISYDNTKAQRISTFRWKLTNTK